MQLEIDEKQLRELEAKLKSVSDGAPRAMALAINRTAAHGRTNISRRIAREMTAQKGAVAKRITVRKATRSTPKADIVLRGKHGVNLIAFGAHEVSGGVSAKVMGTRRTYAQAFIAEGVNKNRVVFKRDMTAGKRIMTSGRYEGKLRQPIHALKGPSVPEIFRRTPGVAEETLSDLKIELDKNLASQVNHLLNTGKTSE